MSHMLILAFIAVIAFGTGPRLPALQRAARRR